MDTVPSGSVASLETRCQEFITSPDKPIPLTTSNFTGYPISSSLRNGLACMAWAGLDRLILASYPGGIRLRGNKYSTKVAAN